MLKKIALAGLFVVTAAFGATASAAASSGTTKSVKPAVTQPAPQGLKCWSGTC